MRTVEWLLNALGFWARAVARRLMNLGKRLNVDSARKTIADEQDARTKFSRAWYQQLYAELGDGIRCFRPVDEPNYSGGTLTGCTCCKRNIVLHLLPHEEKMFSDLVNDSDFRLIDHPRFHNRKSLVCSKMGLCHGRKPFVCRTHPVYFVSGLMLYEETLCRLISISFINIHAAAVERIRSIVYRHDLADTVLGYGRTVRTKEGKVHIDFEH